MSDTHSDRQRMAQLANAGPDALARAFPSLSTGLSPAQAQRSRDAHGPNQLDSRHPDTVAFRLRRAFINPFSLILLVLAGVSLVTDVLLASNYSRNATTCILITGMLLLSGVVRFIQEMRSRRATERLLDLIHTTVQVKRDGQWRELPSEEVVVGDVVRFHAGDRVPADLRLTSASDLFLSQSTLTGESAVVEKDPAPLPLQPERPLSEYRNIAFAGSSVIGGSGEGVVIAVGRHTAYGDLNAVARHRKTGFDEGANSIAWVLIRFMAVLAPLVFLACGLTQGNWGSAFLFALSVAVGLTPELLPMVITACLAKGSAAMGKKDTIVKNINAMQSFGSMDVLCVDKTGTLTGDRILLEYYMDILGNESAQVLEYAYLNSLYHTGVQNHLDDAIRKAASMPGKEQHFADLARQCPKLDELPFDYHRKLASVAVSREGKPLLLVKGNVEEVCARCQWVEYRGNRSPMGEDAAQSIRAVVGDMTEDGMKVLAVAYKPLDGALLEQDAEQGLVLLGYLAFFDAPKQSAAHALSALQGLHVSVKVLTGDEKDVALSVCRRLGMPTQPVLTGRELDALPPDLLPIRVEQAAVLAQLSPRQKADVVTILRENGHTVGFLGDGMNDLPAILASDVGVSAEGAAESVQEAADVILLKKDLNVLEEGVLEGRKVFANMSKYIRITASSNFGNIVAIVVASLLLPFFPMSSVQLLLLNLLYDVLCLVLPWDAVDEDLYARPRAWSGGTLGRFMAFFGPISSLFDLLTFAFLYFILCPAVCGASFAHLSSAAQQAQFISLFQTGWFLESMWTQVLILHLLRTKNLPFLQSRPAKPVLLVTVTGILLFTGLTVTPLGALLGLTAMPPLYFAFLLGVVLLYLCFVSFAKARYTSKYYDLI